MFERLREQAKLQLESRDLLVPLWRHRPRDPNERRRGLAILPAPSDGDVFFDMEGFPYAKGGLEYLFGVVTVGDDVVPVFRDWRAHDAAGERAAFEGFIDWLVERRQRYPDLHVDHYAAYEESAVKRLAAKFATRESEVDELLRGEVFVDLYNVVRQGFIVGTTSYSLKKIEHLYEQQREGQVVTAGGSVVEYQKWIDSGEARELQESLDPERDSGLQPERLRVGLGALESAAGPSAGERYFLSPACADAGAQAPAASRVRGCRGARRAAAGASKDRDGRRRAGPGRRAVGLPGRVPPPRGSARVVGAVRAARPDDGGAAVRGCRMSRGPSPN